MEGVVAVFAQLVLEDANLVQQLDHDGGHEEDGVGEGKAGSKQRQIRMSHVT